MIRYLLAVALLVAACLSPICAGEPVMKADPAYGVKYAEEKIATLPQDQNTPYLTLFGDRNDPRFQQVVKWFDSNRTLTGLKEQTHFNVIYSDMPMFRDRYASSVPALPCVRLQDITEEEPVAEYSGVNVPMTPDALARGLNSRASNAECFRRRHSCPEPQPVVPIIHPDPPPAPVTPQPPVPKARDLTWVLISLLGLAGAVAGTATYFGKLYRSQKV